MATVELTKDNFEDVVTNNDIVFVDFWASWCGPCKMFGPIFEAASEEHSDIVFAKVNTEEQQELAGYFNVRSIPTLMIFRDKIGIFSQPGALPAEALQDLVGKVRDIDMDDVRRQIAEQQKGETPEA